MDYQTFIQQVQDLAGVDRAGAERVTQAALGTLGEFVYRTEQGDFGAQLPSELRGLLASREGHEVTRRRTDRHELQEFYNRVKARAGLGFEQAVHQSRVVMAVLRDALDAGAWKLLRGQFPAEYDDLFAPSSLDRQTIPASRRSGGAR